MDVLLEALAQVLVPCECVIAGAGNHRAHCETLCRKFGLENRVRFTGFVPQETLKQFYREASVAVLSSVWPEPLHTGPEDLFARVAGETQEQLVSGKGVC